MALPGIRWWAKTPFVRLLFFLLCGIVLQWSCELPYNLLLWTLVISLLLLAGYSFLSINKKFAASPLSGISVGFILVSFGALLVLKKDVRNQEDWIGNHNVDRPLYVVVLEEPMVEKARSFKAVASVNGYYDTAFRNTTGRLIIYFSKEVATGLDYGSVIVFKKPLQRVKSTGNPHAFDYARYCLFAGITHQVYLTQDDYIVAGKKKSFFRDFIFNCRQWVLATIRKYIPSPKEAGLAEALLIGYKDDLDKSLVQAYSNTGVVHVIAISGLHLGLIYWILLLLTRPLKKRKGYSLVRLVIIVTSLWVFSILAGGQPSVLRSAVMFTCLAAGEVLNRKGSVYNTLALSAFVLLCINPFWLWDLGFQLSYAAMLSILLFFKPVYNWFYFANPFLDFVWKLNAVTLAAQLLTMPLTIHYFHQLPTLFLLTNLVAVPLSSAILVGEIVLCAICFIGPVAHFAGFILEWMIRMMNDYIERLDAVSFSTWSSLNTTGVQTLLFTFIILATCFWFMEGKKWLLRIALFSLLLFMALRSRSFLDAAEQRTVVVYNVPGQQAIDLVSGRRFVFVGDEQVLQDESLQNFHLRPARTAARTSYSYVAQQKYFEFAGSRILIIDSTVSFRAGQYHLPIDLLVLSGTPRVHMAQLQKTLNIAKVVIDSSVPAWKKKLWKKDCDSLGLFCFDVSENGAFVMRL